MCVHEDGSVDAPARCAFRKSSSAGSVSEVRRVGARDRQTTGTGACRAGEEDAIKGKSRGEEESSWVFQEETGVGGGQRAESARMWGLKRVVCPV